MNDSFSITIFGRFIGDLFLQVPSVNSNVKLLSSIVFFAMFDDEKLSHLQKRKHELHIWPTFSETSEFPVDKKTVQS